MEEHHYALSICPRHRADFGIRWRTGKTMCTVPKELAVHKTTTAKGSHRVDSLKSAFIFKTTNTCIPVGSRKLQTFLRRLCYESNECSGIGGTQLYLNCSIRVTMAVKR